MKILITGALGYIVSHTVVESHRNNHQTVLVDNLSNSKKDVLDKIKRITGKDSDFYFFDVKDKKKMESLFKKYQFDAVIHFAGFKSVKESIEKPLIYYENNLISTLNLAHLCVEYKVNHLVFSSSATVYGDQTSPLKETMSLNQTTNPYGETKKICERILIDLASANKNFKVTILRYFNPVGAHPTGLIGEDPNGIPNNLVPFISKVAKKKLKILDVYGNDYDTIDGTGIRDYIHVVDLSRGHIAALEKCLKNINIYNLGTGKGVSDLQMINTYRNINNVDIPYRIVNRRPGDVAISFAETEKAKKFLGWETTHTLEDMVRASWRYELNND